MMHVYLDASGLNIFATSAKVIINGYPVDTTALDQWDDPALLEVFSLVRAGVTVPDIDPETETLTGEYAPLQVDSVWSWVAQSRPLTTEEIAARLADAMAARIGALTSAYVAACAQPVAFASAGGVVKTFQADVGSAQILQQTLAGLSGSQETPPGFWWLSEDNTRVPFTYADLQGLAAAMLAQGWAAFQRLQILKAQVKAAATVAEVNAVKW